MSQPVPFPLTAQSTLPSPGERASTGIPGLDDILGGGFPCERLYLVQGDPGVGKTTLALQYIVAGLGRGENAALFSFEEGRDIILARAQKMNVDLRTPYEEGHLIMQQVDPTDLTPGEFAHRVRDAVENQGVKMVVIDSLNGYLYAMPEERHLILHMHELLTYLNQQGVVTILVAGQSGFLDSEAKSSSEMSYMADAVFLLRHFEASGVVRLAISMIKKRSSGHERTIRELFIENEGIQVGPPLTNFRGILTGEPEYLGEDQRLMSSPKADDTSNSTQQSGV